MMMNNIFVPSIPATGTRFLLTFLEKVTGLKQCGLPVFLHQTDHKESNLLHIHVWWDDYYLPAVKEMCERSHVIIPLRDPLAAVVRANTTRRSFGVRCAKSFLTIKELGDIYNVHYLPVDVLAARSRRKRLSALRNILPEGYGDRKILYPWSEQWPIHNERVYDLKDLYVNKDIDGLSKLDGWSELIETKSILRPWLEKLGYKKLIWW